MENAEPIWVEHVSKSARWFGRTYYYNIITKESLWEKPEGVAIKLLNNCINPPSVGDSEGSRGKPEEHVDNIINNYKPPLSLKSTNEEHDDVLDEILEKLIDNKKIKKCTIANDQIVNSSDERQFEGSNPKLPDKKPTVKDSPDHQKLLSETSKISTEEISRRNKFKTPVQDRFEQQQKILLVKQERTRFLPKPIKSPGESSSVKNSPDHQKPSSESSKITPEEISRRNKFKTPIQDRFEQQKKILLENQERKRHNKGSPKKRKLSPCNDSEDEKRLKTEDLPTAHEALQANRNPEFDLRQVLNSRQGHDGSDCDENEMDWENITSDNDLKQETVTSGEQARTSPSKTEVDVYKRIYLVCDTSSLCIDTVLVEKILKHGKYLGLPEVVIVIPFGVFDELDKVKTKETIGANARQISRIINNTINEQNSDREAAKTLLLQDGSKSRETCCSLTLESPDDLILNCCLQQRESCAKDELAILITEDLNLANKASSFKLVAHKWYSFKKWARGLIYRRDDPVKSSIGYIKGTPEHQLSEMEVDSAEPDVKHSPIHLVESNKRNHPSVTRQSTLDENIQSQDEALLSCSKSYADNVKLEFHMFLQEIIEDAVKENYEEFKSFSSVPKPSWTIFDVILHFRSRWFLIMDSQITLHHQRTLQEMVALFKKTNMHQSSSVQSTTEDMEHMFALGIELGQFLCKKHKHRTTIFLDKLKALEKEWKEELHKINSTSKKENSVDEKNLDTADVVVQIRSFTTAYECLKKEKSNSREEWLSLYLRAGKFLDSVERSFPAESKELMKLILKIDLSIEELVS